ncbi:hypothetical protein [Clostridium sp. C2-6-12]|uniref:YczE/YyaS/YitT family protein n=1 Tax=Clostridium sp. C2-6-12 TaxID=2698832 RepID=UPI00136EA34D|nr:hypothetical protein [Clostridium sp. C2-6-12]
MNKSFNLIKRLILFFIGMTIIQFGVALFLKSDIGSDPFTVFNQGLAFALHTTPGKANIIILVVLTCLIFVFGKSYINIGTLICVFGVGPAIDFALNIVSFFSIESYNIFVKGSLMVFGCMIVGVGFSILSATSLGMAPNDSVYFIIKDKTKFQYRWVRMTTDICYLIAGYFLGGVVGVGTIIAAFLPGPVIQFCLPYGEKFVNLLLGNKEQNNR